MEQRSTAWLSQSSPRHQSDISDINRNKTRQCTQTPPVVSDHNCPDCKIKFDTSQSLEVHLKYHKETLLSKWAAESEQTSCQSATTTGSSSPQCPVRCSVLTSDSGHSSVSAIAESSNSVSGWDWTVESPVDGTGQPASVATVSSSTARRPRHPPSSMQISMAQSMGIQQGAAPHLSTHHQSTASSRDPIFNSLGPESGQSPTSDSATPSLPSINTDVSEFFSQFESHQDISDLDSQSRIDSFESNPTSNTDSKTNKFISFESGGEGRVSFPIPTTSAMSQVVISPIGQNNYQPYTTVSGTFSDTGLGLFGQTTGPGSGDFVFGSNDGSGSMHDQSSEEIWDMDSHTVRRYNPVPDQVSPGPIPTTPTMYGQQMQVQGSNKPASWESGNNNNGSSLYSPYSNVGQGGNPNTGNQGQPLSPGQWIQNSISGIKGSAVLDPKRPKTYQCEPCDKWFTSSGHLKRHFNTTLHKNAMKQKDGYCDGMNGGSFSIPSVESGGAPSPCMSLGEESSQSSVCDDSQSLGHGSTVSRVTPTSTPGPPMVAISTSNQPPSTSQPENCSPSSNTSIPAVPNTMSPSGQIQLLSPPPDPLGPDSSPLSGLSQLAGVPPPSPSTHPGSGLLCPSPNNPAASPVQKNRFSPFRSGPPSNTSYKVQNLDQRNYPSYPSTFQPQPIPALAPITSYTGDIYLTHQQNLGNSSYRNDPYSGQYSSQYPPVTAQYQPVLYSTAYETGHGHPMGPVHGGYITTHPNTFTDISNYSPMPVDGLTSLFPDHMRTFKTGLDERTSPEGSDGSDSLKNDMGEFKCNECNKVFNRICYLKQHNKSFHNGEKPFKCTQCGKRFPVEVLYQEHLAKHAGDKPYKCEVCPKQFNHKTDLRRHMCLHTGEKPFTCDVCGKGFIREDRMVKHADTHKKKAAHVAGGLM